MSGQRDEWWTRNPDVVFRVVAGERLLVPVRGAAARTHRLYSLNALGASVWELLESGRSYAELCGSLKDLYPGTPEDRIEADTTRFLEDLERFGLLRRERRGTGHGV